MIGRDDERVGAPPPALEAHELAGRIDVCPTCDGTGWMVVGVFYPGTLFARVDERRCETCRGRRFVRVRRG